MAGFKFEVGIKKGIRTVKDPWALSERKDLIEDWGLAIKKEARRRAALPAEGTIYGKGRNTGALVNSITLSDETYSKSRNTVYRTVFVDEAMTKTQRTPGTGKTPIATSYARFEEYGTGIWSEDPGSPKAMIVAKKRKMTWVQYGKPYRGNYIRARSVADYETKTLARPRLVQKRGGGSRWGKGGGLPHPTLAAYSHQEVTKMGKGNRYQTTYNKRKSGGPWQQTADAVQGVRPKRFMRDTVKFAESVVKKDYARARDEVKRGVGRTIFFEY